MIHVYNDYNYKIMELPESDLRKELESWSREDITIWLKWNDPNGIYRDEESLDEIGEILSLEAGIEIIVNQIIQSNNLGD